MTLLPIHIAAGVVALAAGAVALSAFKGSMLHRQSGMIFVYAMLGMSTTGAVIAALYPNGGTLIAGVLTFYLVATALRTIRRPAAGWHWGDAIGMLLALVVGITSISFAVEAAGSATGTKYGYPPPLYVMFATVALLSTLGDARMLARGLPGSTRLARHLWRVSFAMWIATASSFLGQAELFAEPLRHGAVLAVPVLGVLVAMFYWLARVRFTQKYRHA